jgi:hypothetical protein
MKHDPGAVVGAFVDAFNAENLDALVAALAESVEIHGGRGVARGRDAAREWATRRPTGELRQRLVVDRVHSEGDLAVALIRRQWLWSADGELADEQRLGVLVELDDVGLIRRWRPFDDPADALAAAGLRERGEPE